MNKTAYIVMIALIVALGGFLMGFDASVISGVNKFIELEFGLTKIELGWAVASLTLTSTLAMLAAGPLSDRYGRKTILYIAAALYGVSALGSALAPNYLMLVIARMIGGFGVGASLIIAPMYIAEIAPPQLRGRMVSFNQLNIVVGISVAFFTNYIILQMSESGSELAQSMNLKETQWRWMLGIEALPALLYFVALFAVPRSPRWLAMKGKFEEAMAVMRKAASEEEARKVIDTVRTGLNENPDDQGGSFADLFKPAMRLVITIGLVIGILQQITGINSVFFYAPMIFEQSGIGTDASFVQAILVGLVNLVFTLIAIALIDKLGRKPLLVIGVSGIVLTMFLLAYSFNQATYTLTSESITALPETIEKAKLMPLANQTFESDLTFKAAMVDALGADGAKAAESDLLKASANMNSMLILFGILGFVASFAISVGPVMWVLFSELFPNRIRAIAISFVGLVNSAISFLVQLVFPWELENLGSSTTFMIYGIFALLGLIFIIMKLPETKGKSLEELEKILVK